MDAVTKNILDIFEQISQIPRQSKHEEAISTWLVDWAKKRDIEVEIDEVLNVLMHIPATKGYENKPIVVLQGHMDMVCEKTPDSNHDFQKDPIEFVFKGDWLYANKTTLGADNGIALAYALAIVESGVPHPELELLFTVDEETGLTGANALAPNSLKGKYLLNIDSEDEGIFTIGCCGGVDTKVWFPLKKEPLKDNYTIYELKISGCMGGHSGQDIVKHRANANILLVRTLWEMKQALPLQLISLHGGTAHNAIPREAIAVIAIPNDRKTDADKVISQCVDDFTNEYLNFESGIEGSLCKVDTAEDAIETALSEQILRLMLAFPNGPQALDPSVYNGGKLIAEISNNFATIRTEDEAVRILSSQRSQVMSSRDRMTQQIEMLAHLAGAEYKSGNGYASWQPNWDSALLATSKELYIKMFGKEPVVNVVHGGLECGVIGAKHEGMDMISLGPTIENPHSPDERMYVPSIKKVWEFLTELLITL
ncbi:MAG: aminoacyl-histidine dipeptidase [Candidatus Marinimicrobia bacterium]|nr:aminoacyl-histidine dipeptidase [Candidatus Neomarinimicrobiota bacterium]